MSENRRYYWLKLQETFFEDDTIDFIESQENGEKYVLFYLKLCLKALKNEGKLIRYVGELLMPYDEAGIAKLTKTDIDTVRSALILFTNIGLIKRLETGEIYLTQINELIGTETADAQRKRRQRINEKARIECDSKAENVTLLAENVTPVSQISHTDIDIELDKDKEIEKDINSKSHCDEIEDVSKSSNKVFPRSCYTQVITAYSNNYLKLYDDMPAIDYKVISKLLKQRFETFGYEPVLKAVTDSINHKWVVETARYSFSSILSSKILTDLINGNYESTQSKSNQASYRRFDGSKVPDFFAEYLGVENG